MHDIKIGLGVKNIFDLTIKEIEGIYGKKRKERIHKRTNSY